MGLTTPKRPGSAWHVAAALFVTLFGTTAGTSRSGIRSGIGFGLRSADAAEDPDAPPPAGDVALDLALAESARAGVVRVQWRGTGPDPEVQERNAIVVDAEGLLLLSGPVPSSRGTLTATFSDGGAMKATVVASDEETSLTLLWVPVKGLQPLPLLPTPAVAHPAPEPTGAIPPSLPTEPLPPGTRVVMVTGTGAVARGWIRGNDRHRELPIGPGEKTQPVTGLLEAAMPTVAEDLGSPWLDEAGRVVGLLVSAVGVATPTPGGRGTPRIEPVAAHAVSAMTMTVVWNLLRAHRAVPRSRLGVAARPAGEALEVHACKGCAGGQLVVDVEPEGPASRAGVERHDILVAVGGAALRRGMTLADALLPHRPGTRVPLDLIRKGERLRVEITLGSRADD